MRSKSLFFRLCFDFYTSWCSARLCYFFDDEILRTIFQTGGVRFKQFAGRWEKFWFVLFSWSFQLWPCDRFSALLLGPIVQIRFGVLVQIAANRSKRTACLRAMLEFCAFSKLVSETFVERRPDCESTAFGWCFRLQPTILYAHQVLMANFFV
jgi:hypothetical protein